jgi:hypothetical protein
LKSRKDKRKEKKKRIRVFKQRNEEMVLKGLKRTKEIKAKRRESNRHPSRRYADCSVANLPTRNPDNHRP